MRIDSNLTDDAVLAELGSRLASARLERNLTQRQLGDAAGVDRLAIQHIEAGRPVKVTSLIRILRALGLLDALERMLPEPTPSPIEQLKLHGRRRRRASGAHSAQIPEPPPPAPWRWGDENA
jgi:transcriptional regulator with XRE-family HTH domain